MSGALTEDREDEAACGKEGLGEDDSVGRLHRSQRIHDGLEDGHERGVNAPAQGGRYLGRGRAMGCAVNIRVAAAAAVFVCKLPSQAHWERGGNESWSGHCTIASRRRSSWEAKGGSRGENILLVRGCAGECLPEKVYRYKRLTT